MLHIGPRLSSQNKKCTCVNNRCIQSKISGDNLECWQVELSVNVMLARSRWASNYYITPATGSSDQLERRCWNENHVPAEAGPPGPRLSSPGKRERNAAVARRVRRSICCSSVQSPTHLSQIIPFKPFRIKREVYFSKELCPLVFIVLSLCFCMYMCIVVVYWPSTRPNMPFQSDAPEGSDTFWWQLWEEIA